MCYSNLQAELLLRKIEQLFDPGVEEAVLSQVILGLWVSEGCRHIENDKYHLTRTKFRLER